MIILKAIYHVRAYAMKCWYKLLYGKNIVWNNATFRAGFKLMISNGGKVNIGKNVFFNNNCSLNSMETISIGGGGAYLEKM